MTSISSLPSLADFTFSKQWMIDSDGPRYLNGTPKYVIDLTTGRRYWNVPKESLSEKGCLVASACLIPNAAWTACYMTIRSIRLATCYHFWLCMNREMVSVTYSLVSDPEPIPEPVQTEAAEPPPDFYMIRKLSKEFVLEGIVEGEEVDPEIVEISIAATTQSPGCSVLGTPVVSPANSEEGVDLGGLVEIDLAPPSLKVCRLNSRVSKRLEYTKKYQPRTCGDRISAAKSDLVKLALAPIGCIALEFFACYTFFFPSNNGRKLYQILEEVQFDGIRSVECFSMNEKYEVIPPRERVLSPPPMQMMA